MVASENGNARMVNLLLEKLTKCKLNDLVYLDISGKMEIKKEVLE